MSSTPNLTVGRIVRYVDATGHVFPAIVTGFPSGKTAATSPQAILHLCVFGAALSGTMRDVNFASPASKVRSSWHWPPRAGQTAEEYEGFFS